MILRVYFMLDDRAAGDPALVPVLRTVPKSSATASAGMTALLRGPSAKERAASPRVTTLIPAGTELLGIEITGGTATVDLSGQFASGGGSFSVRGRLAQVTYTLTQFATIDRVSFKLDGKPVTTFSSEAINLDKPVTRATYRDDFLPPIFVDRPAWGAVYPSGSHITGLANVFEGQFRITLREGDGKWLFDGGALATCGSGCWGRFDVTVSYDVSAAEWGVLRVMDCSEKTGLPIYIREYPVHLRPAP